jgi:hypothetical protein
MPRCDGMWRYLIWLKSNSPLWGNVFACRPIGQVLKSSAGRTRTEGEEMKHLRQRCVMLKAVVISVLLSASPVLADASRLTAADFLDMNETYRAAMIHGLLASVTVLGLAEQYRSVYDDGVKCRLTRGRHETVYGLSSDFARYLDAHPDDTKGPFPLVFLLFMAHCQKN